MKLRSFYSILAGVVGLLLLIAAIGFFWLVSQSPLGLLRAGQEKTPAAAMFVPRQAPAMVSLLVNPDRLESFRLLVAKPGERRLARTELAQLKQSLLANTGLNYEQDIKPWLGQELTLAITTLDIDRDPANGKQPGYLLALGTQDAEQSREFLQLFWQKRAIAGTDLMFEQYKGVKLIYGNSGVAPSRQSSTSRTQKTSNAATPNSSLLTPGSSASLASAVVGDHFVLFANHPKVLRDAINNVQATDLSLMGASFYSKALESLAQPRVGLSFINLPGLANWLAEESGKPVPTSAPDSSSPYQTMAIALELDRRGLLVESAVQGRNKSDTVAATLAKPVGALQYIPESSSLAASGTNLARLWDGLAKDLNSYEAVAKLVNQPLKDLQATWKLDVPQDIFSWVKGEYALGLLPAPPAATGVQKKQGKLKSAPLPAASTSDWVFIAQRSPADLAQQSIEQLDKMARQQGLSVGSLNLGDQVVSVWTQLTTASKQKDSKQKDATPLSLQAEVRGVHASVGDYEIFAQSLATLDTVLKSTDHSLSKRDRFQQAIAPISQPNDGYLYLDWKSSQPMLEQRFPLLKVVELAGKPLFNHLQSLTISGYGSQAGVQRGGMFIKLS